MKFEKDVFISYAHLDDKPLDEGARGWITDFHRLLETRLEQTIGYEINIWRDERLTGNEVFAPEIESQLPTLKVMVSIITPRYLNSEWCRHELGAFYKAAVETGGLSIGNKSRIFKIIKTPVDHDAIDQLPEGIHKIFDEILDYKFYVQETSTGKFRELTRDNWVDNTIRQEYMNKLDDVVQDMANLIKTLNNNNDRDSHKKKIYLAETSYDLEIYRDNLVRELQEAGFLILPDKNLSTVSNKYVADVENFLDQSILSVHLVSATNYAAQPEGTDKSTVILQNEIAAQKSQSNNLSRLIWIPPAAVNASTNQKMLEQQNVFVNELKTDAEFQKNADILEGPIEELKQVIFDTIKRLEVEEKARQDILHEQEEKAKKLAAAALHVNSNAENKLPSLIYLVCDQRDLDNTRPLEDMFVENGCEILLPLFDGDQAQLRQAHLDNLKICDAVIIYYGAGNYRWVGSMKSDLLRLPAMGREKPLTAKAIYIQGPSDKDKETFRANDIHIINGLDGLNSALFNSFIQSLNLLNHE